MTNESIQRWFPVAVQGYTALNIKQHALFFIDSFVQAPSIR
jgi:hypothetical protein